MDTKIELEFEYTNTCNCEAYDEDTDSYVPMDYCDGSCWDLTLEDFRNITEHLFDANETLWWKVSNIRLWDGESSGYFFANSVKDLIEGMTVNSAWIMRGTVFENRIEYSLSHHDAPVGSNTTLTMIDDEQREELGLY